MFDFLPPSLNRAAPYVAGLLAGGIFSSMVIYNTQDSQAPNVRQLIANPPTAAKSAAPEASTKPQATPKTANIIAKKTAPPAPAPAVNPIVKPEAKPAEPVKEAPVAVAKAQKKAAAAASNSTLSSAPTGHSTHPSPPVVHTAGITTSPNQQAWLTHWREECRHNQANIQRFVQQGLTNCPTTGPGVVPCRHYYQSVTQLYPASTCDQGPGQQPMRR
ncbi:MAG: hypothetical protein HQL53_14195 [Magnetococcales bacterium]|nr:hypothetical protein [Magnetococcales bacterium]